MLRPLLAPKRHSFIGRAFSKKPSRMASAPAALRITERAAKEIKQLLETKSDSSQTIIGVRLGVRTRGCNGYSYTMNFLSEKEVIVTDERISEHGVEVFVDNRALFHVIGSTMDFESDHLKSEFTFHNPNVTSMCGCGESFSTSQTPPTSF